MGEFVPLSASLRIDNREAPAAPPQPETPPPSETAFDDLMTEVALARLATREAYDRAVPRLLAALAREVLGRELALAPPDLEQLIALGRARFAAEEPVAVWLAPADAPRVVVDIPVRSDPALQPGDLVLEVRDGELDARFAVRLAGALAGALERV
jgi:flagellar biosynthesis/type III secretory pathway protein FliH